VHFDLFVSHLDGSYWIHFQSILNDKKERGKKKKKHVPLPTNQINKNRDLSFFALFSFFTHTPPHFTKIRTMQYQSYHYYITSKASLLDNSTVK
jgi:hypothetical protein